MKLALNLFQYSLIVLVFFFWPTSFLLKNSIKDFIYYFSPNLILVMVFFLYARKKIYWMYPLLLIPVINSKLLIFPFIIGIFSLIQNHKSKVNINYILIAVVIFILGLSSFYKDSVFMPEHFDQQKIIMKANLYPEAFPAKLLQNALSASWINFKENFFLLIDPNNYFFGLHPREKVEYQNVYKFSFVYIIFFLIGLYYISHFKYFKFVFILLSSIIINLSLIKNFDLIDSIIFLPIILITIFGIFYTTKLWEKKACLVLIFSVMLLIISIDFLKLLLIR